MDLLVSFMGLFVGFMVGLTGVGGAALLTPILILIGIHPTMAVGTDLFYNSITKLFGTVQHFRQKTINKTLVLYLAVGSIPGAVMAIMALRWFDSFFHNQETIIKHALGIILILVAVLTILRQFLDRKIKDNRWVNKPIRDKRWLTIGIGFTLGFIVGITSIGSGSLFAIAMIYLFNLRTSEIVGTDIAHAFMLVTVAGLIHAGLGHVNFQLAGNLLIGSVPGVLIGSSLSAKVPSRPLRTILAALILIGGIKLI